MEQAHLKPGERIDRLIRENIQIIQSKEVFSFSLDAVLLAEFANIPRTRKATILDFCAGNGAISFFLSPKTSNPIVGLELQEELVDMARRSADLNHLSDRLSWIQTDVRQATAYFPKDSVDVITCNPPYFKLAQDSPQNIRLAHALARHEIYLPLADLLTTMADLLKMKGKAYLVHRPERLGEIIALASQRRLEVKRLQFIHPKRGKEANIVLIELMKDGKPGLKVLDPIIVYQADGSYSPEVEAALFGGQNG